MNREFAGKRWLITRGILSMCALSFWFFVCLWPAVLFGQTNVVKAKEKEITQTREPDSIKMEYVIKAVPPEYPSNDRRNYHQGKGLYRVTVDQKTGSVTSVQVIKSTGWPTLDEAAMSALRQWRLKPGKVKAFNFPVTYTMARSREDAMEKIRRTPGAKQF